MVPLRQMGGRVGKPGLIRAVLHREHSVFWRTPFLSITLFPHKDPGSLHPSSFASGTVF